jgi:hypothetical protein
MISLSKLIIIISAVLIISSSGIGCRSPELEYCTYNVKNRLVSYKFEYSTYYRREGPMLDDKWVTPAVYLNLNAPRKPFKIVVPSSGGKGLKTVKSSYVPAAIEISVYLASNKSSLNAHNSIYNGWVLDILDSEYADSLTQSTINISGIEAEYVTFTYDWFMPFAVGNEPMLKYYQVAAFDYGGYIWNFTAWSEKEMVDQVKTDFEHVIQTFKVISVNTVNP